MDSVLIIITHEIEKVSFNYNVEKDCRVQQMLKFHLHRKCSIQ